MPDITPSGSRSWSPSIVYNSVTRDCQVSTLKEDNITVTTQHQYQVLKCAEQVNCVSAGRMLDLNEEAVAVCVVCVSL